MAKTTRVAYIFPGQGSQKVGMGRDLYDSFKSSRAVFDEADKVLGFPLSRLCFEGPEDELRQTINAQPALVTVSFACLEAAFELGGDKMPSPVFLAGHSLGEYTALAVSGVLDFATAVHLARERGRLMHEAGMITPGGMAAIIGLDEASLAEMCRDTGTCLANINCPGQLVISGSKENVANTIALAEAKKVRAIPLQVSGAFHSPLMQPAAQGMSEIIGKLPFMEPIIPIIANTTGEPLTNSEDVKAELMRQLTSTVQWQRSIEYMVKMGVSTYIEIGAGKVLTGLIKRISKEAKTVNIGDINEIKAVLAT